MLTTQNGSTRHKSIELREVQIPAWVILDETRWSNSDTAMLFELGVISTPVRPEWDKWSRILAEPD